MTNNSEVIKKIKPNIYKVFDDFFISEDELVEKCKFDFSVSQKDPIEYLVDLYIKYNCVFYDNDLKRYMDWDKSKDFYIDEILDDIITEFTKFASKFDINITKSAEITKIKLIFKRHLEGKKGDAIKPEPKPTKWIPYKNYVYDIDNNNKYKRYPNYYFMRYIKRNLGKSNKNNKVAKIIRGLVKDEDDFLTLKEIIAYTVYDGYEIEVANILLGSGSNGKTTFTRIIKKLIGEENVYSLDFKRLSKPDRFTTNSIRNSRLLVVNEMLSYFEEPDLMKKIVENDDVTIEAKNQKAFSGKLNTKLIFTTNIIPKLADNSQGTVRRLNVTVLPFKFEKPIKKNDDDISDDKKDILYGIPDSEYDDFLAELMPVLKNLLKRGRFKNQGTIDDQQEALEKLTCPINAFLELNCEYMPIDASSTNYYISKDLFFGYYNEYLRKNRIQKVSNKMLMKEIEDTRVEYARQITRTINGESKRFSAILGTKFKKSFIKKNITNFELIDKELYGLNDK